MSFMQVASDAPRTYQIDRAAWNSDLLDETFQSRADLFLTSFAMSHRTFTASKVTNAARLACVESTAHGAWGSVFRRAQAAGTIERIGFAPRKNGNPAPLYCSRVFVD
ncbi:MAG: hypothetical protein ABI268_05420 [Rhodanobacter sp.]